MPVSLADNLSFHKRQFVSKNHMLVLTHSRNAQNVVTNCVFHHSGLGVVIGNGVRLGNNCQIYSNVVIGSKAIHGHDGANPVIGDGVVIGAGAIILGDITIGDNSIIAAGAVVLEDIPTSSLVAGNPAEVKKKIARID